MAMSFLVLAFMWAKFTVIWGIARFFALLDGVAPPENMRRFFADNHTVTEFWKNAPGLGIGSKEIMAMSFLVLAFMWAKFTVIWGIARFFALLDGVAPPENMRRFFADNH